VDTPEVDKDRITQMLREWSGGDQAALDGILPFIYDELHRQAVNCLRRERKNHTLQTTALIHEAYLKLVDETHQMRYFADLSLEETAEALHISRATVARDWNTAKLWLRRELTR
jgi:DNA-directed RNA polymerase specialized sigma subunit